MRVEEVKAFVGDTPGMKPREAYLFYDLITSQRLSSILELGFLHGVSTTYLAGAVQELGLGRVTTIGLNSYLDRRPNIDELLSRCGLQSLVKVLCEPRTYNWRLMKLLEEAPRQTFDLCYINGGHQWVDTGFAFFLSQRLLRGGGWLVFNSITHTFRKSSNRDQPWVLQMTEEEQTTPQADRVFTLLAMRDEGFDTYRRIYNLGLARKRPPGLTTTASSHLVEIEVCNAASIARGDPALRHMLLEQPAHLLSKLAGKEAKMFEHVKMRESPFLCPLGPELQDDGTLVHYLERPDLGRSLEPLPLPGFLR
jgi:predicted O-methyltransferase YrrM